MNRVTMNIMVMFIITSILNLNSATVDRQTVNLQQIRERLQLIKQGISDGITLSELRSLRNIITGISSEEADELEKEIDDLLNEPFDLEQELLSPGRETAVEQDENENFYADSEEKHLKNPEEDILDKSNVDRNSESKTHEIKETVLEVENDFAQHSKNESPSINIESDKFSHKFAHKWKYDKDKNDNEKDMKIKNHLLKWNKKNAESKKLKENVTSSSNYKEKGDSLVDKLSDSVEWGAQKVKESIEKISSLGENLKTKDTELSNAENEMIKLKEDTEVKDYTGPVQLKTDKVKDGVDLKADILKDAIDLKADKVKDAVDWKADILEQAVEWKSDKLKDSILWGNEKYINITEFGKNKYDGAIKKIQEKQAIANEIKDSLKEKVSDSIEWGADKVQDSVEWGGNIYKEVNEEKKDAAGKIKDTATKIKTTINDKVQDSIEFGTYKVQDSIELGENVYKKFVEEKKDAAEKIKETANKVITTINDTVHGSLEWGSEKVKDFVQLAEQKKDTAKEIKESVLDKVKDTIKQGAAKAQDSIQGTYEGLIHSASEKVAVAHGIKDSLASTIQNTIEKTKDKVKDSVEKTIDKVKDSVEKSTDKVKNSTNWKEKFGKVQLTVMDDSKSIAHKGNASSQTNVVIEKPKIKEQIQHINKLTLPAQDQEKEDDSESWLVKKLSKKIWKKENKSKTMINDDIKDKDDKNESKWKSKGTFFNLWGGKESDENLVKKLKLEENIKEKYFSKISGTVSITIKETSVKTNPVIIYHTETAVDKIKTLTVTSTVLEPSTVILEEVVTIADRPVLLTKTISFTETKIHTVETLLPKTEWKTKSVVLSITETDVEKQYETVYSNVPVYETVTDYLFRTSLATQMKTHLYASTLTVTSTQLVEIPVSVTQTKSRTVEQLVTETVFKDKTITKLSTVEQTKTKTEKCKKGFFEDIKKFG